MIHLEQSVYLAIWMQDVHNIYHRYPKNIPKIPPKYHQDTPKISPGLVWSLVKGLEQFERLKPKCVTDGTGRIPEPPDY